VTVLPVCLKHLGFPGCQRLGEALAGIADEIDEPLGIVASSDMTHYRPAAEARTLDHRASVQMLARDPEGLYQTVHREGITMCGVIPATVALVAANLIGATSAHLSSYATSGDASGDWNAVVGYAGVCLVA
jgi:AmmeMemoRadiSam system protein B